MSGKKKHGSRFGTAVGWTLAILFILGFIIAFTAGKRMEELGKPGSERFTAGLAMMGAAVFIMTSTPLLPPKLRGVQEMSLKVRVIQVLTKLFTWVILGGFGVLAYNCVQEPQNTLWCWIGAGIFVIGFAGAWITVSVRNKLTKRGDAPEDAHVVLRAESDKDDNEAEAELLKKLFPYDEEFAGEERGRELEQLERSAAGGVPMTKEQFEQYEDMKHGRK